MDMAEQISSLNKGLSIDTPTHLVDSDSVTDAYGRTISDLTESKGLSSAELGNAYTNVNFTDESGNQIPNAIILGEKTINQFTVYAICNTATNKSILAVYNSQANTYSVKLVTQGTTQANGDYLNFNNANVKYVAFELRFNTNNDLLCYLVDGFNIPKVVNLTQILPTLTTLVDFENYYKLFNTSAPLPKITDIEVNDGGNLLTTVFQFAIRHKFSSNVATTVQVITNPIPIVDKSESTPSNLYYGNVPGTAANKNISFTINNLNLNFKFYDVIVIYFDSVSSQIKIGVIENNPIINNTTTFTFSDISTLTKFITINELVQEFASYDSAKDIIQKDNTLILLGLKKEISTIDWQTIANSVKVYGKYKVVEVTDNSNVVISGNGTTEFLADIGSYPSTKELYKNPLNTTNLKTFSWEEIYSFAFVPILANGEKSFAFPIQNSSITSIASLSFNTSSWTELALFTSSELLPDGITPIKFHATPRFNDIDLVTTAENSNTQNVNLIKLKFEITGSSTSAIQTLINNKVIIGWKIVQQPKNKSLNKRVVTTGIAINHSDGALDGAGLSGTRHLRGTSPWFIPTLWNTPFKIGSGTLYLGHLYNKITFPTGFSSTFNSYPFFISPDVIENNIIGNFNQFEIVSKYLLNKNLTDNNGDSNPNASSGVDNNFALVTMGPGNLGVYFNSKNLKTTPYKSYSADPKIKLKYNNSNNEALNYLGIDTKIYNLEGYLIKATNYELLGADTSGSGTTQYDSNSWLQLTQNSSENFDNKQLFPDKFLIPFGVAINNVSNYFGRYNDFQYIDLVTNYLDGADSIDGTASTNFQISDIYGGEKFWCKYAIRNRLDNYGGYSNSSTVRFTSLFYGWFLCEGNYDYKHYIQTTGDVTIGTQPYFPASSTIVNNDNTKGILVFAEALGYPTGYNKQYQINNNILKYFPKISTFETNTQFPNRHIYSQTQIDGDNNDYYRIFLVNDYYDLPKNAGFAVKMFIQNTILYTKTTLGLWRNFYNSLTSQSNTIGEVFTGTGGAFTLPSTLLTTNNIGGQQHYTASVQTPYGEIWLDSASKTFFLFNKDLTPINNDIGGYLKNTINNTVIDFLNQSNFDDNPYKQNKGVTLVYDNYYKRFLVKFWNNNLILSYSFLINDWVSKHLYNFKYINSSNDLMLNLFSNGTNLKLYKWYIGANYLQINDTYYKLIIEYVVNDGYKSVGGKSYKDSFETSKVFDNLVINTNEIYDDSSIIKTFNKMILVDDLGTEQETNLIVNNNSYSYENDESHNSSNDGTKIIKYKNFEFRLSLPRQIFNNHNRYKGKNLKVKLEFDITNNFNKSIPFYVRYIKTLFRINSR